MSFYDLRKITVLIVEDSVFAAKLLRQVLRGLAVGRVEQCLKPEDTLKFISDIQPDLVFLDRDMPSCDGLEVAQNVRKGESSLNPFIPIVMVSAKTKMQDIIAAREAGVTEYLAKPVSSKLVYERMVACIEAPRPFIRTKAYFGPDRRRRVDASYTGPERRKSVKSAAKPH